MIVNTGTCVSLLDGIRIRQAHPFDDTPEERWVGDWSAESKSAWIRPEDRAKRVEIEFDVGAAWSERPRGYGFDVDLDDSWCPKLRTFTKAGARWNHGQRHRMGIPRYR